MIGAVVLSAVFVASALGGCPDSTWMTYGDDCYWLSSYTASWRDARTACVAMGHGSDLASIHNVGEDLFIFNNLGALDTWIGLNDLTKENNFVWSDGTPLDYTNWMDGQPNNLLDQDCVNVQDPSTGKWDDNHCVETKTFICRINDAFGTD